MGKNGYLERRKVRDTVMQDAIRQTYQQYMTDMLILTLNDLEVMGKDVFGYKRLKKVLDAWGKNYDKYFDALTKKPEADYARAKIDAAMKLICGDSQDFIPFEQRYEWLPEIRYDRRGVNTDVRDRKHPDRTDLSAGAVAGGGGQPGESLPHDRPLVRAPELRGAGQGGRRGLYVGRHPRPGCPSVCGKLRGGSVPLHRYSEKGRR